MPFTANQQATAYVGLPTDIQDFGNDFTKITTFDHVGLKKLVEDLSKVDFKNTPKFTRARILKKKSASLGGANVYCHIELIDGNTLKKAVFEFGPGYNLKYALSSQEYVWLGVKLAEKWNGATEKFFDELEKNVA